MKKSILSIVAIAVASVAVFTSCDKNDDGYGQSAKPAVQSTTNTSTSTNASTQASVKTEKGVEFVLCIAETQPQFIDESYTLNVNGKEMTLSLSQMQEICPADTAAYLNSMQISKMLSCDKLNETTGKYLKPRLFKVDLGTYTSGSFKVTDVKRVLRADHPDVAETNFVFTGAFFVKGNSGLRCTGDTKAHVFKGVYLNNIDEFLNVVAAANSYASLNL